jgi:hypothetical protein
MRYIMRRFDEAKKAFGDSKDYYLDLPAPLDGMTIGGIVQNGMLKISV